MHLSVIIVTILLGLVIFSIVIISTNTFSGSCNGSVIALLLVLDACVCEFQKYVD